MSLLIWINCNIVHIVDIDECALGTADCSHMCTNNLGAFECSCRLGFRVQADGKTCEGRTEFKVYWSSQVIHKVGNVVIFAQIVMEMDWE